jgi:hypothetical protein
MLPNLQKICNVDSVCGSEVSKTESCLSQLFFSFRSDVLYKTCCGH